MSLAEIRQFLQEAASWPTGIDLNPGVCCAIHCRVDCEVRGGLGCSGWKRGTHRSIAVLYDGGGGGFNCHAFAGQRVLDLRVALEAVNYDKVQCAALSGLFLSSRYMHGFPVSVSVYGSGYCYLVAFPLVVRARVARILGPLPLVVDVLRLMRLFGQLCVAAIWKQVGDDVFHVMATGCGRVRSGTFFRFGWSLVKKHGCGIRVGMDREDSVDEAVMVPSGSIALSVHHGFASFFGLPEIVVDDSFRHAIYGSGRMIRIRQWFQGLGIEFGELAVVPLFYSTVALAGLVSVPKIQMRVKLWAIMGDHVLKFVQSAECVAFDVDPKDFTSASQLTTNKNLAAVFASSGLRDCCDVGGLDVDSSANGTIVEAVVAVIALYVGRGAVVDFMRKLGLLASFVVTRRSVDVGSVGAYVVGDVVEGVTFVDRTLSFGLSSREFARAVELRNQGKLF